jgi:hypothetical protein
MVALVQFGVAGLVFPALVGGFAYLGQKDLLGPVQAVYSIFDTQVSLLRASVELMVGDSDGTWDVDAELREAFE